MGINLIKTPSLLCPRGEAEDRSTDDNDNYEQDDQEECDQDWDNQFSKFSGGEFSAIPGHMSISRKCLISLENCQQNLIGEFVDLAVHITPHQR